MQPANNSGGNNSAKELKKVHSLDYGERQEGASLAAAAAAQEEEQSAGGGRALLMHSVSIVVDFAKEKEQRLEEEPESSGRRAGWRAHSADGWAGRGSSSADEDERGVEHDDDDEDDDEDDEDDDDDDDEEEEEEAEAEGCLSSELARRVVLVDEADKILWSRAQSAEPRFEGGAAADAAPGGHSALVKGRRQSAAPTCSQHFARCSSGELAERGALSMRRNTHHQVAGAQHFSSLAAACAVRAALRQPAACSPPPPPAAHWEPSGGAARRQQPPGARRLDWQAQQQQQQQQQATTSGAGSQQQRSASGDSAAASSNSALGSPVSARPSSSQSGAFARNWRERRQSLQISLLSGSACYSHSSKSLTEEELRSEREFNEQVRSISNKSPIDQATQLGAASTGAQSAQRGATQSVLKSPALAARDSSLKPSRVGAPRRVSFSSADPTALVRLAGSRHRASVVAFHPESAAADAWQSAAHTGCPAAPREKPRQEKRHSTALLADPERGWLGDAQTSAQRSPGESARHSSRDNDASEEREERQNEQPLGSAPEPMTSAPSSPARSPSERRQQQQQQQEQRKKQDEASFRKMNDNKSCNAPDSAQAEQPAAQCRLHSDHWQTTCTTNLEQQLEEDSDVADAASTPKKQQPAPGLQAQLQHEQDNNRVQSIMANARLRQEEFARLLEEHEQIVNEINRVETKISSSQTSLTQQQQQQQQQQPQPQPQQQQHERQQQQNK